MAGTREGGIKTAKTIKEKYGDNFYRELGAKGGKWKGEKGFAANRELARAAGALGGSRSKRGPAR